MAPRRERQSSVRPAYLSLPAFKRLGDYAEYIGQRIWCTDEHLHVGLLHAVPHEVCAASPDAIATGLFRQLEEEYNHPRRLDDTPLADERVQLSKELGSLRRLANEWPWQGRSYGSKRELFQFYILPWINAMEDSTRRIFQQLEMLMVARQQRGQELGTIPSVFEKEYLTVRSDFDLLSLWLLGDARIGSYPYRVQRITDQMESLIESVVAALASTAATPSPASDVQ